MPTLTSMEIPTAIRTTSSREFNGSSQVGSTPSMLPRVRPGLPRPVVLAVDLVVVLALEGWGPSVTVKPSCVTAALHAFRLMVSAATRLAIGGK